jgi:glycosyltransferase involved in cell wall biosynthesis
MKFSLVIPAYNASKTIRTCLESALNQTISRESYEIIVVDDGSTDGMAKIVEEYPVRLLRQENQGPAVARNKGAYAASGDILVFTDSDCELDAHFLVQMGEIFEREPAIAGVQGSYRTKQREFMARFGQVEIETRYAKMAREPYIDFIGTYAAAYRRSVFVENDGFDTGFPRASGEDTEFSYKVQKQGHKLVFSTEAFVYHQHPASLKHYLRVKFVRGFWRVRLYRMHPEKTVKDSYTPNTLKFQVLTAPLVPPLLLTLPLMPLNVVPLSLLGAGYVRWSAPFVKLFLKHGYARSYLVPAVLVLRAGALASGLAAGFVNQLTDRG